MALCCVKYLSFNLNLTLFDHFLDDIADDGESC